jgi:hypothetical protein
LTVLALAFSSLHLAAQEPEAQGRNGTVRVFLECATRGCDSTHFRTEVTFVNWVRDLRDSQVHLVITSQQTGSGQEYLLDFTGRGDLEGIEDLLTLASSNTDSDDERVHALTGVLAVGLARFAVLAGQEGPFTVGVEGADGSELPPGLQGDVDDPWNYWVFRLGGEIEYDEEESERSKSLGGNFSASRTTEAWEFSVSGRGSVSQDDYDITADSTIVDQRDDWSTSAHAYYSLADRWSVGLDAGANSSTRSNTELGGSLGGALEFSFFPYSDWTRRRMTVQASVTAQYFEYDETTIYGKDTETVWQGSVRWSLGLRQPWGTANLRATYDVFLHDPSQFYRRSAGGRLSFRIARGLEWNIDAEVSKIRDQIFLSAAELTPEEVLLQRRQLPTDYSFEISTGFSFTFGSIFNNVVNNRLGGGGGNMRHF